jgi:hypothetical protein
VLTGGPRIVLQSTTRDGETWLPVTSYAYDLGNRPAGVDASGTADEAPHTHATPKP